MATSAGPVAAATADETALPALDALLEAAEAAELAPLARAEAAELALLSTADATELAADDVVDVDPELHALASKPTANTAPANRPAVDHRFRAPSMLTPFVFAQAPVAAQSDLSPCLSTMPQLERFSSTKTHAETPECASGPDQRANQGRQTSASTTAGFRSDPLTR